MSSRIKDENDRGEWNRGYPLLEKLAEETGRQIYLKKTHQDIVATPNLEYDRLNIYNWALPNDIDYDSRNRRGNWNIFINDSSVHIEGSAGDRYHLFSPITEDSKYLYVYDERKELLALISLDGNNIYILNDIIHCDLCLGERTELEHILLKYRSMSSINIEEANRMNPEEVTATFIRLYQHKTEVEGGEEAALKELDRRVEARYAEYLREIKAVAKDYRLIKSHKMGDLPVVIRKAKAVTKSLTSNPFISTLAITNNHLRVTTKKLLSKYYEGGKSLIISIPIYVEDDRKIIVRIYELDGDKILRLPYYNEHIYPESNICLGTLNDTIAKNLLGGDWDLATMSIIRGMIGGENKGAFSEMLKWYAQNPTETKLSRAITAVYSQYRSLCDASRIYNLGGNIVHDLTRSEDGYNSDCNDSENYEECCGDCDDCSREDCDDRIHDPSSDCDNDCKHCREDCGSREEEYCRHDCENCGNDCDERPSEEDEEK